ncbi:MAG: hypothetical protein KatS3mg009_0866 [Acidimicrobiia bacterium]|nr:MAG: hypothetical protein KatS3mg009_0866 [Acidimicrobiia bacterium]
MPPSAPTLPAAGTPVTVRPACCGAELPTRVVGHEGESLVLVRPAHSCGADAVGREVLVTWTVGDGLRCADGVVRAVRGAPVRWVVGLSGPPVAPNRRREERVECRDTAVLRAGRAMIPAQVVNRSRSGLGCLVGGASRLAVHQEVTVEMHGRRARARVVRVRPAGTSLDVGLRLLEPLG